jgi:hypothetical protein
VEQINQNRIVTKVKLKVDKVEKAVSQANLDLAVQLDGPHPPNIIKFDALDL